MKVVRIAALSLVIASLVVACAGSAAPTAAPPTGTPAPTRIEVSLLDTMRIEPAAMTVPAGIPVTFIVTNEGQITHDFTLGDVDVQDEHEQEMLEMGGMSHGDAENVITVDPGETKELVYTFEAPGTSLAGCHVPGHYPAGMKATITIAG
ncbi:MAG: plastocyanin/azurin family copper-binding protein [Chloroflexota bacterium]